MNENYPSRGELVVCKVTNLKSYGAFVNLIEYDKEGFIHVSNIASGWVKNIRSHVSQGQIRVALVVNVDREKHLIDVSFRKVTPNQEKRKLSEWKRAKRAEKLFERVCQKIDAPFEEYLDKYGSEIIKEHGDLYSGFEAASLEGTDAFKGIKMPKGLCDALTLACEESITVPMVSIKGKLLLTSYLPDGIDTIRKATKGVSSEVVQIAYISAPEYALKVEAHDYEEAEKALESTLTTLEEALGEEGEVKFERS